jgi:hypothetical protein
MVKKEKPHYLLWAFVILIIVGSLMVYYIKPKQETITEERLKEFVASEYGEDFLDFVNSNFVSGGPPKDGIPSIDEPKYVTVSEADLDDSEKVFGFDYNGVQKVFPRSILYWHEIVNEEVNGEEISVTYCPLTETVIGYKGEFGVSGNLYNSNLVLYDRKTDSDIPQILQKAVNGVGKGSDFENFYIYTTTWGQWKEKFPDSLVLTEDTGADRDYSRSPYPGYENALRVWFPLAAESDLFQSKKIIHGIEYNHEYLAVPKDEFKLIKEDTYVLGGEEITIKYEEDLDIIKVFKKDGGQINSFDGYWFAWYAYHPDTNVYNG